ncbi:hypothetical protein Bca4012_046679 [Brassica carinata]
MAFAKMFFLFSKFQQGVGVLAKSTTFSKNPRQLQYEADINKLFMFTSYNRLGRDAEEADAEEIIEMAGKATLSEQQKQVQENIHYQLENFCASMDEILLPHNDKTQELKADNVPTADKPLVPETKPLKLAQVSKLLKDRIGYTLEVKPSLIPHKDAGQGCFIEGEADVGALLAFYPGVIYPPGYPNVDAQNSYLITRYDGVVINAQPWGRGGESRQVWNGSFTTPEVRTDANVEEVLEMRNPLAFGHFLNHQGKDMDPNVMVCPYDFPLSEMRMRTYIPNVALGDAPVLKTLVLVATRALCNEELMLNYRLSNSERRPEWYTPVDEEEDGRRCN